MKFTSCLFLLFVLGFFGVQAQTIISGKIQNSAAENLMGATVTVSKDSTGAILAYGISGADGDFRIKLSSEADTVFLKVSFIGYSSWKREIPNSDQDLEVVLKESAEELKEVVVKARIIQQSGDTLSFRVSAFKDQKDRVIADVLKKMPGIEIMPGGQIHYQGEPIQKYYIEGLDLLEGRYSLANNNISAEDVSEVQILENHQPVKVLDSLQFSERASLNIRLKRDVTMSGTAEVGGGFSPLLWKTKITPMIFTKKQQAIVTYQANNTGSDVSREIRDFSISDFGREEFRIDKRDWLGIRQLSPPPFEQERWLDNNVHLGSVNYLIKLRKEVELKTNISYLNDAQRQIGSTQTLFFTPTDTIELVENIDNNLFINTLQSKFFLERNTNDNYLKNELELNKFWDTQRGSMVTRDGVIQQKVLNPFSVIRNKLRVLRPVGKQLVTFRSNTGYTEANQRLRVSPGQFSELLNEGEPYSKTEQVLASSTFFTDNSAGFTRGIKNFTIAPEAGFSIRKQQLDSRLGIVEKGIADFRDGDFRNRLDLFSSRLYFTSKINYKKNNWNVRLTTPVNYRSFTIEDAFLEEARELNKLSFEPNIFINKEFSTYWESSISANLSNDFRDFRSMYNGFILSNYRNIQRYNSPLPESFSQSYSGRFSYRNPLSSLFAGASYTYGITENNLLYSNFIGGGGAILFEALEQENTSIYQNLNLEGSKYFNRINTTLDIGSSLIVTTQEQLLNNSFAQVNNRNLRFNLGLESEVTDWLSTSYDGAFSFLQATIAERDFDEVRSQQHLLGLSFFPSDRQYFSVESEYYYNNISPKNRNSFFLNLGYRYTFEERKIDLSATWNNVFNTNEFVNIAANEFSYVQSTYRLRPSQLLLSLKFTF